MMGKPASVFFRSHEKRSEEASTSHHSAGLDVESGGSTLLLVVTGRLSGVGALATGGLEPSTADELTLDLALVGKGLEEFVTSLLDVAGGLDVEGALDVIDGRK